MHVQGIHCNGSMSLNNTLICVKKNSLFLFILCNLLAKEMVSSQKVFCRWIFLISLPWCHITFSSMSYISFEYLVRSKGLFRFGLTFLEGMGQPLHRYCGAFPSGGTCCLLVSLRCSQLFVLYN